MSALPLSSASYSNSQKFSSLIESLSLAEEECKKFRTIHVTQSSIDSDLEKITAYCRSRVNQKSKHKLNQYRGKQSIFKQFKLPAPPRAINRSIPDHHKNPHKWTKYSLENVLNANDRVNAQTAFAYLSELRIRKKLASAASQEKEESMEVNCEPALFKSKNNTNGQIQFRKPEDDTIINTEDSAITPENNKPIFRNSEVVMPEYVVGQKHIKKIAKKKKVPEEVNRSKSVKLDHLQYPEEEE